MKTKRERYPIATICAWRDKVDETPEYQRPPVWSRVQKQLLIDSILRGYDIPKVYWRTVDRDDGVKYEVIDGQQRLRAIWEFKSDIYPLPKGIESIEGFQCGGQRYGELDIEISTIFDSYPVDVVIVEGAAKSDEVDEIGDLFLRLQNGTALKAQEKRNAMPGQMRDFVKLLAEHPFFENCRFSNSRFTFDHVVAQMICLEIVARGRPASVRDRDLNRMYQENKQFEPNGGVAKKVQSVLDYLLRAFPEKTPELERYNAITLYCIASNLIEKYVYKGTEDDLASWFIEFETNRRSNDKLEEDQRDPALIEYKRLTSYSTDTEESIKARVEHVERLFFSQFPDIEPKDEIRTFSHEQRLAIYRRGKGICQIAKHCNGEKLSWNDWHADHIKPYSQGGKTVVSNGQVACQACNLSKGGS